MPLTSISWPKKPKRRFGPGGAGGVALPVGHLHDAFARQTPVGISVDHEPAGHGEDIDRAEMFLEPHLAQQKMIRRALGKTLVASHRAGIGAERTVHRPHHMPLA